MPQAAWAFCNFLMIRAEPRVHLQWRKDLHARPTRSRDARRLERPAPDVSRPLDRVAQAHARAAPAAPPRGGGAGSPRVPVTLLGHKGDLMLIHLRRSFEELQRVEAEIVALGLSALLEPVTSF